MEVVEAAAAQLETLKFSGIGSGVGPGEAVVSPDSVSAPEPPPPPPSDEGSPDTGQDAEAQLAREQPPELASSTAVGGNPAPQLGPEPPPGGTCGTGPGAAELVRTPASLETSDSDSDSDRSCLRVPKLLGEGLLTGGRSRAWGLRRCPRGPGREGRSPSSPRTC